MKLSYCSYCICETALDGLHLLLNGKKKKEKNYFLKKWFSVKYLFNAGFTPEYLLVRTARLSLYSIEVKKRHHIFA